MHQGEENDDMHTCSSVYLQAKQATSKKKKQTVNLENRYSCRKKPHQQIFHHRMSMMIYQHHRIIQEKNRREK